MGNRSSRRDIRAIKKGEKKTELFKWSEIDLRGVRPREGGILVGRRSIVCGLESTSVFFCVKFQMNSQRLSKECQHVAN